MSNAIHIAHGTFGRVALLNMGASLIRHAAAPREVRAIARIGKGSAVPIRGFSQAEPTDEMAVRHA